MRLLGPWIIPGIVLLGVWTAFQPLQYVGESLTEAKEQETYGGVVVRAIRVYLFVMALTRLGEGFKPVIDRFGTQLDAGILYWINMGSTALANGTLAPVRICPDRKCI